MTYFITNIVSNYLLKSFNLSHLAFKLINFGAFQYSTRLFSLQIIRNSLFVEVEESMANCRDQIWSGDNKENYE